jgi:predicted RNA-binding protein
MCILHDKKLEIFIVMEEGWTLKAVGGSTGSLHSIGHSRWSTREDTNLGKEDVLFLEVVKEGVEVGTTKVGDRTKTSEQTLAGQLLEIALADVLWK